MTITLTANDTCAALFAAHPEAVYAEVYDGGTEEWMTVEVPCTGGSAYFMITRDSATPGRYTLRTWPAGTLGEIENGTEGPGEITDILNGIPLRKGSRS